MKRGLFLFLLALAAGAGAAYYLRADNGYVLVSWGPWILETSVLGLAVSLALGGLLLYHALRLLIATLRLPDTLRQFLSGRRASRARSSFGAGLQKLLEGQWRLAEIELVRRAADHEAGALNYLLAARAAQRMNAAGRRDHYLSLAARQGEGGAFAASLSRAELQLQRGDVAPARSALRELHQRDPRQPYVIELLAETLTQTGDWMELRDLLLKNPSRTALPVGRHPQLLARALIELLQAAARDARLDALKQAWESAPASLRNDAVVRRAYVQGLVRLNAHGEAAAQITAAMKQGWDAELARLYGELEAGDKLGQLATTEAWLRDFGEQPELLLIAGRACLRNKLWGKARSYLEAAVRQRPGAAAHLELARLCENTQAADEAARHYKQGLELAALQTGAALP